MTVRDLPPVVAYGEGYYVEPNEEMKSYFEQERDAATVEAHEVADELAAALRHRFPDWHIDTTAAFGSPHRQLAVRAEAWKADLVAIGSHGRGALGRAIFGSVARHLVHHCPVSVRVCRPTPTDGTAGPLRLLLASDGSVASEAAAKAIASRTWPAGTSVRVVTIAEQNWALAGDDVISPDEAIEDAPWSSLAAARRHADAVASELREASLEATGVGYIGYPRRDILEDARKEGADTIFLGAVGHSLLERAVLGSVAAATVADASCSVEIVRPTVEGDGE